MLTDKKLWDLKVSVSSVLIHRLGKPYYKPALDVTCLYNQFVVKYIKVTQISNLFKLFLEQT